jgi:uncharacterized protein (DUF433 family)
MHAAIIDRGRGPEIAGTRVTVYDILDYIRAGWHSTTIAATLRLSSAQVLAETHYIEEHQEEVDAAYQTILDRIARGHPPDVQAKVDAAHAKFQTILAEHQRRRTEGDSHTEGDNGRPAG